MASDIQVARRALGRARAQLLRRRNVVAVGIGWKLVGGERTDRLALVCSTLAKRPPTSLATRDLIPATVGDVPTDVVATGPFFARQQRTDRVRPAPGGVSVAHAGVTAGTLGCLVRKHGRLHILSNNHVLANSNDATVGDAILQPGPADGGRDPDDRIARLSEWVPIRFGGEGDGDSSGCSIANTAARGLNAIAAATGSRTRLRAIRTVPAAEANRVDCAIAEPLDEADVSAELLELGTIAGVAEAALDTPVRKSGRTTGLTRGVIQQVDVSVRVSYGPGREALFGDQLMAGPMSQGGDSGSAVLNESNEAVGLLFAGSDNSTVINRIQDVFELLEVTLP